MPDQFFTLKSLLYCVTFKALRARIRIAPIFSDYFPRARFRFTKKLRGTVTKARPRELIPSKDEAERGGKGTSEEPGESED